MNALEPTPAFDPARSLGWRDIGLDGLSCYLRCVEAVLHTRGYDSAAVASALAEPLRLIRPEPTGGPFGDFPGVRVRWRTAEEGENLWPVVRDALAAGGPPVIVCPDGYWWPSDGYYGSVHAHHHMVLPIRITDGVLEMLDTDTSRESGYVRRVAVDDKLARAFDRIATVESPVPPRPESPAEVAERLFPESLDALRDDIGQLDGFLSRWDGGSMPTVSAQGLHVVVLGDFQPMLFLLRSALGDADDDLVRVRAALSAAAAHAKKLGLLLTGLHRFDSADLYSMAHHELATFVRGLREVHAAIGDHLGDRWKAPEPERPDRFARRWAAVTRWCFDEPVDVTTGWISELSGRPAISSLPR